MDDGQPPATPGQTLPDVDRQLGVGPPARGDQDPPGLGWDRQAGQHDVARRLANQAIEQLAEDTIRASCEAFPREQEQIAGRLLGRLPDTGRDIVEYPHQRARLDPRAAPFEDAHHRPIGPSER